MPAKSTTAPATNAPSTEPVLAVTGDPDSDRLLVEDPLALVIGMLLDQQVPMEWAFRGPAKLKEQAETVKDFVSYQTDLFRPVDDEDWLKKVTRP